MKDHSKRAHALLSASSAHRWLACPSSGFAAELYQETGSDYAAEGTQAHEVAEVIASGIDPQSIDLDVPQEMIDYAIGYRDYIQERKASSDAIIMLEQKVDFSAWVPDGFGTCDSILICGDTLIIIDYKYGKGVPVDAKANPQLRLYALGALNDFGLVYDIAAVEMHIYQPRLDNVSADIRTADELLTWGDSIKETAVKAAEGKGGYAAGAHCKFCPHAGKCRALNKLCTEYVTANDVKVPVPVLAPHEVAEVLQMEPIINLWLKRVHAQALASLLDGKEIPGYKAVEGRGSRNWTDEEAVLAELSKTYNAQDITKTELLSVAQMEKAIGVKKTKELVGELINRTPGSPTIAPESDKRKPYNRLDEAQEDFK